MDWALITLMGTVMFGLVSVFDKILLSRYMPSVKIFYLLTGIAQLVISLAALTLVSWGDDLTSSIVGVSVISGLLCGLGLTCLFYGIARMDVSLAIPIYHTFPVFVSLFAMLLLGDTISLGQWLGIFLTVAGAGLVGISQRWGAWNNTPIPPQFIVLFGAILTASSYVTYKYALLGMDFWNLFVIRTGCVSIMLIAFGLSRKTFSDLRKVIDNRMGLTPFLFTEGLLASTAVLLTVLGLAIGPVALASTLMATRPVFVLIFSGIFSIKRIGMVNEPFTRGTVPWKVLSTIVNRGRD
jgi:transporter family protein